MRLKDSLYRVVSQRIESNRGEVDVEFDLHHPIYEGHFPGKPVTPGVCVVQTAVELCSLLIDKSLELASAKTIKFLHLISPDECPQVTYILEWTLLESGCYSVKTVVRHLDTVFAKCSFQLVENQNNS